MTQPPTPAPAREPQPASIAELEAEITARRERLADTIDTLVAQANPKALLQRQGDAAKQRFADVAMTPQGELRVERIAAVVALAGLVVVGVFVARRRRR